METIYVFSALVSLVLVFTVLSKMIKIVHQSEAMIIERFGRYLKTLNPGINFIIPFIDSPRFMIQLNTKTLRIDLRETVYDFPSQKVITKDNIVVEIDALLYCRVVNPKKVIYEVSNLYQAVTELAKTALRNIVAENTLEEVLISRETVNVKLSKILDNSIDDWGVKISRVEIQEILVQDEVRKSMELQMRAEREKRAKILESEGLKNAQIIEAEGIRQSLIQKAEGEKEALIIAAEGEALAKIKIADAEAIAIRRVNEALDKVDSPANYLIAMKYLDTLKEITSGKDNKVIYLPYEASAVIGSLSGIKDILNQNNKQ
jgi:regulator of protease activity HflC (stomatin/prohibitin superfamily)